MKKYWLRGLSGENGLKFKQIVDAEQWDRSRKYRRKAFKFTWEYCGTCKAMFVRCPVRGNNCCNA